MALWRDIAGYDGLYQVSSDGRVKSLPHFVDNGRGCYQTKKRYLNPVKKAETSAFINLLFCQTAKI